MDGHPKPTSHLQKTPGNGLHKPISSRNPRCKPCPQISTKSLTNEAPKTCPENGPRAHIVAQRPGIWAGKADPQNGEVCKHSEQFQNMGHTGSKPGLHGQDTVPQFVRMLMRRVSSCTACCSRHSSKIRACVATQASLVCALVERQAAASSEQ